MSFSQCYDKQLLGVFLTQEDAVLKARRSFECPARAVSAVRMQFTSQVPELSLPLTRKTVCFMCPYCDKHYRSFTKRTAHIAKCHPGHVNPPTLRESKRKDAHSQLDPRVRKCWMILRVFLIDRMQCDGYICWQLATGRSCGMWRSS